MDLLIIYRYAYWGAIKEIKTITTLYNMCVEVGDGDAAEEYASLLVNLKADFDYIISSLYLVFPVSFPFPAPLINTSNGLSNPKSIFATCTYSIVERILLCPH